MTTEDLADRIMARIERDQAIHKSSIVQELELAQVQAPNFRDELRRKVLNQITESFHTYDLAKRDGYPVAADTGTAILHAYDTQIYLAKKAREIDRMREASCGINNLLWGSK